MESNHQRKFPIYAALFGIFGAGGIALGTKGLLEREGLYFGADSAPYVGSRPDVAASADASQPAFVAFIVIGLVMILFSIFLLHLRKRERLLAEQ